MYRYLAWIIVWICKILENLFFFDWNNKMYIDILLNKVLLVLI